MRLLTLNIGSSESRWDQRAVEVAAWMNLTAPDVVALQEVSRTNERRTSLDEISRLLNDNGYFRHFAGHPMKTGRGGFGVAILSRLPPDDAGQIDLPTDPAAVAARTVAWIQLGTTTIYSAHLAPDLHNTEHRLAQVDVLKAAILARDETTTVLCGDLNCEIDSPAMRRPPVPTKGHGFMDRRSLEPDQPDNPRVHLGPHHESARAWPKRAAATPRLCSRARQARARRNHVRRLCQTPSGPRLGKRPLRAVGAAARVATIAASVLRLIAHRPATTRMQLR